MEKRFGHTAQLNSGKVYIIHGEKAEVTDEVFICQHPQQLCPDEERREQLHQERAQTLREHKRKSLRKGKKIIIEILLEMVLPPYSN
jgi:hypothetical protein